MSRLFTRPDFSLDVRNLMPRGDQSAPTGGRQPQTLEMLCPACGHRLRTGIVNAGRTGRCRACGQLLPIPAATAGKTRG